MYILSKDQRMRLLVAFLLTMSACVDTVKAQVIYIAGFNNFGTLDLSTCTYTQLGPAINVAFTIGPGGVIYVAMPGGLGIYNVATGTQTLIMPIQGFSTVVGLGIAPDGTVYAVGMGLWQIIPSIGTYTYWGDFTNGLLPAGDVTVLNGAIYMSATDDNTFTNCVALIDLYDLANTQCVETINLAGLYGLTSVKSQYCGDLLYGSGYDYGTGESAIYSYNPATGETEIVCLGAAASFSAGDLATGFGYYYTGKCCVVSAGTFDVTTLNLCVPDDALLPFNNDQFIEPDDALQFVLFSNPANVTGSILITSNTATIAYNPALIQTGVTYYAASIAGNALPNGNVNLMDACLDISNQIPVIWHAKPSVAYSTSNPDLCEGDCRTIQVNFTGAAPFLLTISDPVQGDFSLTFPGNTGTFNFCPPIGTPPGSLQIQTTALTDAFCTCE
jgi:hypothetical protein